MNVLLDTHTFLWFVDDHPRLSAAARTLIESEESQPFLSAASLWEIAIKKAGSK
jgi:PIN domain nuclease of toxin-antitoxin system